LAVTLLARKAASARHRKGEYPPCCHWQTGHCRNMKRETRTCTFQTKMPGNPNTGVVLQRRKSHPSLRKWKLRKVETCYKRKGLKKGYLVHIIGGRKKKWVFAPGLPQSRVPRVRSRGRRGGNQPFSIGWEEGNGRRREGVDALAWI